MTESNQTGNGQSIVLAGRVVGVVKEHELVKKVQQSKHLLRSPRGWAIDAYALSIARTLGAVGVRVEDTETGKTYRADLATIDAHGWPFDLGMAAKSPYPFTIGNCRESQRPRKRCPSNPPCLQHKPAEPKQRQRQRHYTKQRPWGGGKILWVSMHRSTRKASGCTVPTCRPVRLLS